MCEPCGAECLEPDGILGLLKSQGCPLDVENPIAEPGAAYFDEDGLCCNEVEIFGDEGCGSTG